MFKKSMFLALAALMLAAAFPVFAGGGTDLKGETIVIGKWWGPDYDVNTFKPNNTAEEEILAWRTKIQQENGFTMREKEVATWNDMQSRAATSIMTGTPAASVFYLEPGWAMALMAQGLLYPVNENKAVNLRNPQPAAKGAAVVKWNQSAIDSMTFGGKAYAFAQDINIDNTQVIFFNKRLFREAGLNPDLPYDMQKAGTWTWDAFLDVCKKLTRDTNNDGRMDTYAMAMDLSTEILDAIISSNGAQYVTKDGSGKFVNATGRPEFLEGLQFAIKLKNEGVMKPRPDKSNWDWFKAEFTDGRVAMRVDESYVKSELGRMRDDWGMVLFPKGPRKATYTVYSRDNLMVIPASFKSDQVDKIMQAVALWFTPVNDDWKSGLYNQFRDARAVDETVNLIRTINHTTKYHRYIKSLERGDIAWEMWFHEGDPAQLVESVSQSWNALINDANRIK
jgi:ABC-type glycerol-3-phosphate transport system substrate-binding protein